MIKKNKKPEAVFTPDGFFVSVTAVRRMIKEAGKKFLKMRAEDEYKHLLKIIDALLESSEKATVTESNRVKD